MQKTGSPTGEKSNKSSGWRSHTPQDTCGPGIEGNRHKPQAANSEDKHIEGCPLCVLGLCATVVTGQNLLGGVLQQHKGANQQKQDTRPQKQQLQTRRNAKGVPRRVVKAQGRCRQWAWSTLGPERRIRAAGRDTLKRNSGAKKSLIW